mgnify:CR=1 FL=1
MKNILIYGDGIIGKFSALVLSSYYKVYLVSKNQKSNKKYNQERFFSINLLTKFMLIKYGLWNHMHKERIFGYNKIITWHEYLSEDVIFNSSDISFDRLGYIVKEEDIIKSLDIQLESTDNIVVVNSNDAKLNEINPEFIIKSNLNKEDFLNYNKSHYESINYNQKAISMNLTCDHEINQVVALQRFDKDHIQGLLPISKNKYNLIWSAKSSVIDELTNSENREILEILNTNLSNRIGKIQKISSRVVYPLTGFNMRKYHFNNMILNGGAAHSIHPMAGLGLNMGIQDIYILNKSVENNDDTQKILQSYENECTYENTRFYKTINFLVKFYTDQKIPDMIQTKSLYLFNRNKLIKNKVIEIATGIHALKSQSKEEYCKPNC